MRDHNFLLGELQTPFPAEILKNSLESEGIRYSCEIVFSADPAYGKELFYIDQNDATRALDLFKKVESQDAEASLQFEHPFVRLFKRIGPILVGLWILWKIYSFIDQL